MNIYKNLPSELNEEIFEDILNTPALKIERIISNGQASPNGFWYDQETNEWVILLSGSAGIRFKEQSETKILLPGDYLLIKQHQLHRVEWTVQNQTTIWLAIHY